MLEKEKNTDLTKEEFELFRDFIHDKAGLYFTDNKMYLIKSRLSKRIARLGIKSYKDYFYRVKYDATMKEFNELMNLVTTNETSFFRNPPQLKSFAEEALPLRVKEKIDNGSAKTIKIWSAGCSTGEEPYTIAMILLEHFGGNVNGWNIQIVATDISEQVLAAARQGTYGELSLRTTPPAMIRKYFEKEGSRYKVKPSVKKLVRFGHYNLNDDKRLSMYAGMDFIFCRNVMIYFSDSVKKKLIRGFYNTLQPGGYLYIGHSESLHGISKAFKLVYFKNALVYHKEDVEGAQKLSKSAESRRYRPLSGKANIGASKAMDMLSRIKPAATTQ